MVTTAERNNDFYVRLRAELTARARVLVAGSSARAGRPAADDLVQEAIAKLFTTYGDQALREREHDQLMSLAWRAMRNIAIDSGRKKTELLESTRPDGEGEERPVADPRPLVDESLVVSHRTGRVQAALGRLDPQERAFIEHVLETDSVPASQRACGWPPKSPYYVLRKILDSLSTELADLR